MIRPTTSSRSVRVAVHGRVVPKFVVSPTTLYFGDVDTQKEQMKRYVLVRRTDGKPWRRVVKNTAPAALQVEEVDGASATGAQGGHRVQVTLNPTLVTQDLKDGTIALWLEDEAKPLTIRVRVFLARKVDPVD
jgi:hypothetical protein